MQKQVEADRALLKRDWARLKRETEKTAQVLSISHVDTGFDGVDTAVTGEATQQAIEINALLSDPINQIENKMERMRALMKRIKTAEKWLDSRAQNSNSKQNTSSNSKDIKQKSVELEKMRDA